jgi:hypothetical protein
MLRRSDPYSSYLSPLAVVLIIIQHAAINVSRGVKNGGCKSSGSIMGAVSKATLAKFTRDAADRVNLAPQMQDLLS